MLSAVSVLSVLSVLSTLSALSVFSMLSVVSALSALSALSTVSVLSIYVLSAFAAPSTLFAPSAAELFLCRIASAGAKTVASLRRNTTAATAAHARTAATDTQTIITVYEPGAPTLPSDVSAASPLLSAPPVLPFLSALPPFLPTDAPPDTVSNSEPSVSLPETVPEAAPLAILSGLSDSGRDADAEPSETADEPPAPPIEPDMPVPFPPPMPDEPPMLPEMPVLPEPPMPLVPWLPELLFEPLFEPLLELPVP